MSPPSTVISVDFEYFSHTPAYRNARGTAPDPNIGAGAMDGLLDALNDADAEATFFVVSDIAERHPGLVTRVADAGHEIASHTRNHVHLSEIPSEERRAALRNSRETLEQTVGTPVTGVRAPSFDVPPDYFDLLADAGYEYDSSVVPCRKIPGWYGGEWSTRRPCNADQLVAGAPSTVAELPVSVMPGIRLPLTGTWLRFFGVRYTIIGMRLLARQGITPVLYFHPWEFCELPAIAGVPRRIYWRSGEWMWRALAAILDEEFEFVTARSVVEGR
ncbi:polysaccharide deacetylase family protein [Haladaptatus sp. DYF46]|uniref:polysaccharide deacetylase family protein n=1 Tax=Haladaptatus sp. DYF46 TaxID=2886041 RepID=UPI001E564D3D|nr:polysaccharide deacetylase family protein [Haladaptatus sp. DYF46]